MFHCSVIKDRLCIAVCLKQLCYYIMSFPACQELFSTFFEVVFVSLLQQLWYLITSNRLLSRTFSFIWRFSFRFLSNQCVLMCNVCYLIIEFVLRQVFFHFFIFSFRTFIYVLSESFCTWFCEKIFCQLCPNFWGVRGAYVDEIRVRLAENRPQRQVHGRLREDILCPPWIFLCLILRDDFCQLYPRVHFSISRGFQIKISTWSPKRDQMLIRRYHPN